MTWNHRVVRKRYENGDVYLGIHEVYYHEEDGKKVPDSVTVEPVGICAMENAIELGPITGEWEAVSNLREVLKQMLRCLDAPILDYDAIGNNPDCQPHDHDPPRDHDSL